MTCSIRYSLTHVQLRDLFLPNKHQGRPSSSVTMMHFPSVSDFPLFSTHFQTPWKIFPNFTFPETFFDFHPPKFLMTFFLVFAHKFQISLSFPVSVYFPPVSRKLL